MPTARGFVGFAVGLVVALVCGCEPSPDVEVDGWALARAALVDGDSCYADRPEYCIVEPEFVDAAITKALADRRWNGEMPKMSRQVDQVVRSARIDYQEASKTPEGLAKIEARVAEYYANPKVDADSDPALVNIDLGALPGRLTTQGRVDEIVLRDSPLIEEFRWKSSEAGRVLGEAALAHPSKPVVRVQLLIPKGASTRPLVYRYFRDQNRVVFGELLERTLYLSKPVEGGPEALAAGQLSLHRNELELCSRSKALDEDSGRWCPLQDAYGERAREVAREAAREARR